MVTPEQREQILERLGREARWQCDAVLAGVRLAMHLGAEDGQANPNSELDTKPLAFLTRLRDRHPGEQFPARYKHLYRDAYWAGVSVGRDFL